MSAILQPSKPQGLKLESYDTSSIVDNSRLSPINSSDTASLEHILVTFLRVKDIHSHPLALAFKHEGIESPIDLFATSSANFALWVYPETENSRTFTKKLPNGYINLLGYFQRWVLSELSTDQLMCNTNWWKLDPSLFDRFRICEQRENLNKTSTPMSSGTSVVAPTPPRPSQARDRVSDFNKTIKRDKKNYPLLKQEKEWDRWYESFIIQAAAEAMEDILDPDYRPTTPDDTAIFRRKSIYMISVLHHCIQTDFGKTIVRDFKGDHHDAQTVIAELIKHHSESTSARLSSNQILTYLMSARLDQKWTHSTRSFILHWINQARTYNEHSEPNFRLFDPMLRQLLELAVQNVSDLRQVALTSESLEAGGGSTAASTWEGYKTLLLNAAVRYDDKHKPKGQTRKQLVLQHQLAYEDDESSCDDYEEAPLDIDTHVSDLHVNMTRSKPARSLLNKGSTRDNGSPRAWLPKDIYTELPQQVRDKMHEYNKTRTDKAKATIRAHVTEQFEDAQETIEDEIMDPSTTDSTEEEPTVTEDKVLAFIAGRRPDLPPDDIRRIMSGSNKNPARPRKVNSTIIRVSAGHRKGHGTGTLVDRGANGGVLGSDVRVLEYLTRPPVSVVGYDNHETTGLRRAVAAGVVRQPDGTEAIAIMNDYADHGKGKTIHSSGQMEHHKVKVNDRSLLMGGKQSLVTPDGYILPLSIRGGLPYLDFTRVPSDDDLANLPHFQLTSDEPWDPSILDNEFDQDNDAWFEALSEELQDTYKDDAFDTHGNYKHRKEVPQVDSRPIELNYTSIFDDGPDGTAAYDDYSEDDDKNEPTVAINICSICHGPHHSNDCHVLHGPTRRCYPTERTTSPQRDDHEPDYASYQAKFGWAPIDAIKRTFKATTQYGKMIFSGNYRKHYKTRNPALNIHRREEPVASDYIDVGIAAIDNGSTGAQVFVGDDSKVVDIAGVKSPGEFVNTLEDNIRKRGAMDLLVTDSAQVEISKKAKDILRGYKILDWQSEPYYQNQNPAERHYQRVKNMTNKILDTSGAPAYCWLLCLAFVAFLLNHMALDSLDGKTPLHVLTGVTPDISPLLHFEFYEPVYFATSDDMPFPSQSSERFGYWVGFSENVGHMLTFRVLDYETLRILDRSHVRSARHTDEHNLRVRPPGDWDPCSPTASSPAKGEESKPPTLRDRTDIFAKAHGLSDDEPCPHLAPMQHFTVDDLIGRSFLMEETEEGERFRTTIKRLVTTHGDEEPETLAGIEFVCAVDGSATEEILTYNEILDYMSKSLDDPVDMANPDAQFQFREILGHESVTPSHPRWQGCRTNVLVHWCDGTKSYQPLNVIGADDPVTCAIYAAKNDLLQTTGWKQFRRIARREKVFTRLIKQARIQQFRRAPKFKFGVQIPYDYAEAMKLDKENGNTKWHEATLLEIQLLDSYSVFITGEKAKYKDKKLSNAPKDYQRITSRFCYDCKHDGRHRGRFVAGGHLTDIPTESVYSGVVAMEDVRLVVFLAELNQLELWGADISSAYLLAETKEKVFIVAGKEFGDREGHILIIFKAQYGLRTSGVRWHDKLFEVITSLGFKPSMIPDVYMRRNTRKDGTEIWEYIATYVDDLLLAMLNPQEVLDHIQGPEIGFKIKGGPLDYHLGCGFTRDADGTLMWNPEKYIDRLLDAYGRHYENPSSFSKKEVQSPLPHGDHPEMDDSPLLERDEIRKYQSVLGSLQWLITLGRFDIHSAVTSMSRFAQSPREGHRHRIQRIVAYLKTWKKGGIRVRVGKPDLSDLPTREYDWTHSIYAGAEESLPANAPEPLGNPVITTHFVDANLEHCKLTGRALTGILDMVNGTPIGTYSKRQSTVETATYGSEIVAARIAVDRIIDIRTRLRYLGIPVEGKAYLFGDNRAVCDSAMPHSKISKRHHALNWHRIREAISAGTLTFHHISGKKNAADVLSKHCGFADAFPLLRPLLFWTGDTADCNAPKSSP